MSFICSALYAVLEQQQTALLMLLGFGGFSLVLAMCYNAIRKHIFHEKRNIDSTFDAGGNVSISLTAVTIACQFFWPLDLLHSATVTIKVIVYNLHAHVYSHFKNVPGAIY